MAKISRGGSSAVVKPPDSFIAEDRPQNRWTVSARGKVGGYIEERSNTL